MPEIATDVRRRAASLLAALCAASLLAGCGGAAEPEATSAKPVSATQVNDDEAAAREVVAEYMAAFAAGDGEAACSLMSEEAVADVVEDGQERTADEAFELCTDAVGGLGEFLEDEEREQAENPEFTSVSIDGDSAVVGVSFNDTKLKLERSEDGGWLLVHWSE